MIDELKHISIEVLVSLSVLYGTVGCPTDSLSYQLIRCQSTFEEGDIKLFYREASIFLEMVGNHYSKNSLSYGVLKNNLEILERLRNN